MKTAVPILTLVLAAGVQAQEWVSVGASRAAAPAVQTTLTDSSERARLAVPSPQAPVDQSGLVAELSMQVEQLQQEIALLRGRVEEQDHQLQQMREEQQQRYLDLDRRLSVLMTQPVAARTEPAATTSAPAAPAVTAPAQNAGDAYRQAMALVQEKKFPEASEAFDRFVQQYPQDALVGNALYWSGEVWLVRGDTDKALQQFRTVVSDFPGHDKAADATYKIGVTLHRQGKDADARSWLQKVIDTYAGKADATVRLARSYLEKL